MKKYMFIIALSVIVTLSACGSESTTSNTKDSTTSVSIVDTTKPVDTNTVITVDSTKTEVK